MSVKKANMTTNHSKYEKDDLLSYTKPLFNEEYFNQKLVNSIAKSKQVEHLELVDNLLGLDQQ